MAPVKIAVLPLSKKEGLERIGRELQKDLSRDWFTDYDAASSIGRRYRRQDEIGTPPIV